MCDYSDDLVATGKLILIIELVITYIQHLWEY